MDQGSANNTLSEQTQQEQEVVNDSQQTVEPQEDQPREEKSGYAKPVPLDSDPDATSPAYVVFSKLSVPDLRSRFQRYLPAGWVANDHIGPIRYFVDYRQSKSRGLTIYKNCAIALFSDVFAEVLEENGFMDRAHRDVQLDYYVLMDNAVPRADQTTNLHVALPRNTGLTASQFKEILERRLETLVHFNVLPPETDTYPKCYTVYVPVKNRQTGELLGSATIDFNMQACILKSVALARIVLNDDLWLDLDGNLIRNDAGKPMMQLVQWALPRKPRAPQEFKSGRGRGGYRGGSSGGKRYGGQSQRGSKPTSSTGAAVASGSASSAVSSSSVVASISIGSTKSVAGLSKPVLTAPVLPVNPWTKNQSAPYLKAASPQQSRARFTYNHAERPTAVSSESSSSTSTAVAQV